MNFVHHRVVRAAVLILASTAARSRLGELALRPAHRP